MKSESDFEEIANNYVEKSFLGELWASIRAKKKYWLVPIVIVLLLFGLLLFLSSTALAPFIYTLF